MCRNSYPAMFNAMAVERTGARAVMAKRTMICRDISDGRVLGSRGRNFAIITAQVMLKTTSDMR
jgi:hypothetical protein